MDVGRQRRIVAVLDTNVLLGNLRRPLLVLASAQVYVLATSDYIIAEVERKTIELGWNPSNAALLVGVIREVAEVVDYQDITGGSYEEWLRDPKDHPIMATALAARADYLVTMNTRDFPPKKCFANTVILTPDAFLSLLQGVV